MYNLNTIEIIETRGDDKSSHNNDNIIHNNMINKSENALRDYVKEIDMKLYSQK